MTGDSLPALYSFMVSHKSLLNIRRVGRKVNRKPVEANLMTVGFVKELLVSRLRTSFDKEDADCYVSGVTTDGYFWLTINRITGV